MHLCAVLFVVGSIVTNVLLLIWLRVLRVPVPALVTLNYFICVGIAAIVSPPSWAQIRQVAPLALGIIGILGILFISVFALTGRAARDIGVGLTGMLAKLSVVLPVGFSALFLGEALSPAQGVGLIAGIGAIIAIHMPYLQGGRWKTLLHAAQLGLLLWLGNGIIDILFKAYQPQWKPLDTLHIPLLIMSVAGTLGVLWHVLRGEGALLLRSRLWGAAFLLGSTNLLSIFFYLKALATFPAVQFFLWNNLGIVLLSGVVGVIAFREKLTKAVVVGYALGVAAIFLVSR